MNTSIAALESFSESFGQTIDNLDLEQKKIIIDILVDTISVHETEKELSVDVIFRFARKRVEVVDTPGEPRRGLSKTKSPLSETSSGSLEAPSGVEPDYGALQAPA